MTTPPQIPDVLATRYASVELVELWSPRTKVVLERRLWVAVLKAQAAHKVDPYPVIAQRELVIRKYFRVFRLLRRKLLEVRSYARLWHTENTADQGRVAPYSNRI